MIFPKGFMIGGNKGMQFESPNPEPPPSPATIIQNTPSPGETSAQAIQAQIDALPKILDAQKQYGDQFTNLNLESLQKYGPEYAQTAIDLQNKYGAQYAEAQKAQQAILNPETLTAENAINKYLQNGPDSLTPEEEHQFTQDIRSSQSSRGLAEAGFSAQDEFSKLTALRQQMKSQYLNTALSTAGRVPVTGGTNVQASPQANGQPLVQNVNPSEIFGGQNSVNALNSSIYGSQVSAYNAGLGYKSSVYGTNMGLVSDIVGAGGQIGAAAAPVILASSRELKENIKTVSRGLDAINKIDPVEFDWINSGEHDGGMIAEQLREVLPQAVVNVNGVNHIKPMIVIAHLIQAVKELSDEVKELRKGEPVYGIR